MKTLHYGNMPLGSDIEELSFNTLKELTSFIYNTTLQQKDIVFVITFRLINDDCCKSPIFITEDSSEFISLISHSPSFYEEFVDTYFLQEYESYEDAYSVALDMREPNELCYNKNKL